MHIVVNVYNNTVKLNYQRSDRTHAMLTENVMYSANRSHRAETRNRTKDELRKVISSIEKVRKWEKKWVLIKDTAIKIQKWVPST
ncbi:unnamed protein product [Nippostrongylus brasiliensis]|uniref:BCL7-like protein (inferred by orthology to a C. elegans protein) n=1 Tax=Nippostrongylus brasiliensis TaxID=27835 RepID=A0A0N4XLX8_NIPBR|nr:unnamed protein product [Nippostrongylus brasiliensis]